MIKGINIPKDTSTGGDDTSWEEIKYSDSMTAEEQIDFSFEILKKLTSRTEKIESDLGNYKSQANQIKESINEVEKKNTKTINIVMFLTGGAFLIFVLTGIMIFMDYWKYNNERHQVYLTEISKLEVEIDVLKSENNNKKLEKVDEILTCLKYKTYFSRDCFNLK